jgi:uncharacterized protein
MEIRKVYGRREEVRLLEAYYTSNESSLIAVIGRRRIGKTFLIRRTLERKIDFEMVGLQKGSLHDQLINFRDAIASCSSSKVDVPVPKNWTEAFLMLKRCLLSKRKSKKKVIFFDELPWMNTQKSGFIEKFAHFWNSWASENNVMLIVSGSAATWMIKNIVNGKGGLHNRITHTLHLRPFNLMQTKEMIKAMGIKATSTQLSELYMTLGGVPYYLSLLQKGKSIYQNIEALLFKENGKLVREYQNLLPSLFNDATNHLLVVEVLASKWKGLTRNEITELYKKKDGGGLTKVLDDLQFSGFINAHIPFQKTKKETLYRISDAYTLFYLKFLKKYRVSSFMEVFKTPQYKTWCGYAFENICLQHTNQIIASLGLSAIICKVSTFLFKGNKHQEGFQIDLLIERADGIIHICEMKYHSSAFLFTKKNYQHVKYITSKFQEIAGKNIALHYTFISANGIIENEYVQEVVDSSVILEQLM